MRRKQTAILAAALLTWSASASTLSADSLLCEDQTELQIAAEHQIDSKGGAETIRQAGFFVQFYELEAKRQGVVRDLAAREEAIRESARLRTVSGARAGVATDAARSAAEKVAIFRRIANTCASSGADAQPATVIDKKPISGMAKIRVTVRGEPAEVWVYARNLAEEQAK